MKTLAQWCEENGVSIVTDPGTFIVYEWHNNSAYRELYNLSDFIVSSVCGIVIWFIPRVTT